MSTTSKTSNKNIAEILLEEGLITQKQMEKALEKQKNSNESLEKVIIKLGFASLKEVAEIISKEWGITFIDLNETEIDPELARSIPEHLAQRYRVIPIAQENNKLLLAMADPFNVIAIDDVRLITGFDIEPVVPLDLNSLDTLDFSSFANYRANYLPPPTPIVSAPAETHKETIPTEGTMMVSGKKDRVLPLKFTEVRADITGMLAEVKVSQKFYNDLEENIEAVYMFPLPHESAVLDFEVITGDKVIKSVIKERGEAKNVGVLRNDVGHYLDLRGGVDFSRPLVYYFHASCLGPCHNAAVTNVIPPCLADNLRHESDCGSFLPGSRCDHL